MITSPTWRELRRAASRHRFEQNLPAAIESFEGAIALAVRDSDAAEEVGVMHNAVADLYVQLGDEKSAIGHLRRGIEWWRTHSAADILLGNDLVYLARLLHESGAEDEAAGLAQEGVSLYTRALGSSHPEVRRVRELLAPSLHRYGGDELSPDSP